ncbi:MAG: hypothetical protein U0T77_02130 [Chitinophagales bacterium]
MEEIIIKYSPAVEQYLNDLVDILFEKTYFSYKENAIEYVLKIISDVETNIHTRKQQKTPDALKHYGQLYISYKSSKRTMWYVFFTKKEHFYIIKHMTNNHMATAQFLNHL